MAEEKSSELEAISIQISQTEKEREQRLKKKRREYPRTEGQLQNV